MNLSHFSVRPKMMVFDLDYTLWPMWVEMYIPPFSVDKNSKVKDRHGSVVKPYPEVPEILKNLKECGIILGVASRTPEIEGAKHLVKTFGWDKYFSYQEIYPGSKVSHFEKLSKNSGIPYKDMLFFDDENRNIIDLEKKGVVSILVHSGVNNKVVEQGLARFERERSH